ncbi:hypothetical protein OX284_011470 [Flavobacterium sp. SUN046]|uniref:hypothetical protein n=1 Tax=Flavobacterium sp. SUN046 TaxID=3002440 RepID=UPI002DBBD7A8|nr:hypothetical protein [Flavobacterium sp. SUN046]MEC4050051.1 hypothetical protein [Flavobacterium sp. SUN046]
MKLLLLSIFKYATLLVVIFLLQGCTDNYYTIAPTENLGRVNVYIEDDITDAEAQAKLDAEIGAQTENIYIQNTTNLTTININTKYSIRTIIIGITTKLTTININGIKKLEQFQLSSVSTQPLTINCNDLEEVKYIFSLSLNGSTNNKVNFNSLKTVMGSTYVGVILKGNFAELNFPALESVGLFDFDITKDVISFPSLKKIDTISCYHEIGFHQLNFPVLETLNNFDFPQLGYDTGANVVVTFPHLKYCEYFRLNYAVRDSNVTNMLLHQFLTVLPASGKSFGVVGGNAPPTGQGIIDKQTLIAQGNYIGTDY